MNTWIASALALLVLSACAEQEGAPPATDAGMSDACAPQSAAGWKPTWIAPETTPGACSDAQIDEQFRRCETASSTVTECTAFNRDPANAHCRTCLYSTEDERAYGPLVYLKNRVLTVNVPGCFALADGNLGAAGCGARLQAFQSCKYAACTRTCTAYDDFQACLGEAGNTLCASYRDDSTCGDPARYAPCLEPMTFEEYFRTFAKIFCGAGFPGGTKGDAGDSGEGGQPEDAGADMADARLPRDASVDALAASSRAWQISSSLLQSVERDAFRTRAASGIGVSIER